MVTVLKRFPSLHKLSSNPSANHLWDMYINNYKHLRIVRVETLPVKAGSRQQAALQLSSCQSEGRAGLFKTL
jgi:hypothetical protein